MKIHDIHIDSLLSTYPKSLVNEFWSNVAYIGKDHFWFSDPQMNKGQAMETVHYPHVHYIGICTENTQSTACRASYN